jgi:drug/metabolite transporter (DMT)-like permease
MQSGNNTQSLKMGILFAVIAAFANSTGGIFSKILLQNYGSNDIAFAKCLVAFVLVGIVILITGSWRKFPWSLELIAQIALCALFGITGMYAFETVAYTDLVAPVVVLCLMGTSTVTTLFIGHFWLKDKMNLLTLLCLGLVLIGLALMIPANAQIEHYVGLLWAVLSGICYGVFLLLVKNFALPAGMVCTWLLVSFGGFYLFPLTSYSLDIFLNLDALLYLIPLAIIPTMLGYYLTTKALSYTSASTVQLFEVTEPIFSAVLAYWALAELLSDKGYVGGAIIIVALFLYQYALRKKSAPI